MRILASMTENQDAEAEPTSGGRTWVDTLLARLFETDPGSIVW